MDRLVGAVALWRVELPENVELVERGKDHEDEVPEVNVTILRRMDTKR